MLRLKKFPTFCEADDYHEFSFIRDQLNSMTTPDSDIIKYDELGCYYGTYIAVLYTGKKPAKKEIIKMFLKEGLHFTSKEDVESFLNDELY